MNQRYDIDDFSPEEKYYDELHPSFYEPEECVVCDGSFQRYEDELEDGICECCMDYYSHDYDILMGAAEQCDFVTVNLPSLITELYSQIDIIDIILEHMKQTKPNPDKFIKNHRKEVIDSIKRFAE